MDRLYVTRTALNTHGTNETSRVSGTVDVFISRSSALLAYFQYGRRSGASVVSIDGELCRFRVVVREGVEGSDSARAAFGAALRRFFCSMIRSEVRVTRRRR